MQDAGARRVSNAKGMRRMVRKHDCALTVSDTLEQIVTAALLRLTWVLTLALALTLTPHLPVILPLYLVLALVTTPNLPYATNHNANAGPRPYRRPEP